MAGESVLVVDDNPANLKLARIVLAGAGFAVRTAVDAESAMREIESAPPRLILMDVQLPGMDGLTLTRQLKADSRYHDIIIIALTAYAMRGDEEKVLAAGCDGYMSKPIDIEGLPRAVSEHLGRTSQG